MRTELINVNGQLVVNKLEDFDKGYALFALARVLQPLEPQRRINLINAQIAMQPSKMSEHTLARLRASGVRGSNSVQTTELGAWIREPHTQSGKWQVAHRQLTEAAKP